MTAETTWDNLAPPMELPAGEEPAEDAAPEDAPVCPVCSEPIIRDPSWKRMRKYHPECASKASRRKGSSGSSDNVPGGSGFTRKAEKEADQCEAILQGAFIKLALAVSVFDKFDAFCIMVNTGPVCQSFRGVCLRSERFRKEMLAVKSGGSVVGLIMAVAFMIAPIFAHHGLIPSRKVAETMVRMPYLLFTLHERMKDGEAAMTVLMKQQMEEMQRENQRREQERQRQRASANGDGDFVGASPS